jgi:hypothetical protein
MESSRTGRSAPAKVACVLLAVLVLSGALTLAGCGLLEDAAGPDIISMQITPSTVSQNDAIGSNDVEVVLTISGFEGEIVDADAFLVVGPGSEDRLAQKETFNVEGESTIRLVGIDATWFGGLDPDTYRIGAIVVSDAGEQVSRSDLTTVTIE